MNKLNTAEIARRFKAHLQVLAADEQDDSQLMLSVKQLRNLINEVRDDAEATLKPEPKPQDSELTAAGFIVGYPMGLRTITGFDTRAFTDHMINRANSNNSFVPTHEEQHALEVIQMMTRANSCLLYGDDPAAEQQALFKVLGDSFRQSLEELLRRRKHGMGDDD